MWWVGRLNGGGLEAECGGWAGGMVVGQAEMGVWVGGIGGFGIGEPRSGGVIVAPPRAGGDHAGRQAGMVAGVRCGVGVVRTMLAFEDGR